MTADPRQLTLPLAHRPSLARADFLVSASNRAAFDALAGPVPPPQDRLALSGPAGSGKTHLASIWGQVHGAALVVAADLTEARVAALAGVPAIVIEDADRIADLPADRRVRVEALLFHALNISAAHGVKLLITGRAAPARWAVGTPDLASRLSAMAHVAVLPPDDALLSSILDKLFCDRQLSVSRDAIRFLVLRMERTFAAAERVVSNLDRMALAARRRVTRNLAMDLYGADPAVITGTGEP